MVVFCMSKRSNNDMTDIHITRASPADSQAIHDCFDAAFRPYATSIEGFPDVTDGLLEAIEAGEVFVVKKEGLVLGAMTLMLGEGFVKLGIVAVDPEQNGRGLGRKLINFATEHARALGVREMRLRTHVLMPQNVDLYEHLGWHETGRDDVAVSMSLSLDTPKTP